jgi:hypothetical protein
MRKIMKRLLVTVSLALIAVSSHAQTTGEDAFAKKMFAQDDKTATGCPIRSLYAVSLADANRDAGFSLKSTIADVTNAPIQIVPSDIATAMAKEIYRSPFYRNIHGATIGETYFRRCNAGLEG